MDRTTPCPPTTSKVDLDLANLGAAKIDSAVGLLAHRFFDRCEPDRCGFCTEDDDLLWRLLHLLERGLTDLGRGGIGAT